MKIGIITFWDSQDNYGQIMQGYALSQYLTKAGHEVSIIRYLPYHKASKIETLQKLNPMHLLAYYKYRKEQKNLQTVVGVTRNFDGFRSAHMKYTEKVYHGFEQLWHEDWSEYDAFVCGSDQIWSPKPEEQLNAYFLQFAPFKSLRIAYAPSFGRSVLPEDYQNQLHELLQHFDAVSVREKEGVDFCTNAGVEGTLVCDPTLLLEYEDYRKLTGVDDRDHHVFCYLINWPTLFPTNDVRNVAASYDGVHYFCTNGQEQIFDYEKNQTVDNWVASIQKSDLSLTNSFHGTVFSILSHTPFVSFPLTGESAAMNNRLFSLLNKLGLEDRIYREGINLHDIICKPIDWTEVDTRLQVFREESENFLQNALIPKERKCEHNVCFLTYGSVHHNYGGLDRVTELLGDYLKSKGAKVYFVSQKRREVIHEDMQHFLPNVEDFHSQENADWLNNFLSEHDIDVLINQEGNVNLTLPVKEDVKRITALHFNPNYIDDNHFDNKFKSQPLLKSVFRTPVGELAVKYLRGKLTRNYDYQIRWTNHFVMLSDLFRGTLSRLLSHGYNPRKVLAINNPLVMMGDSETLPKRKEKTIIYVGRIDNGFKNVDKLIRMWGKIAPQLPDWKFEICGQGGEFEFNKQLIETENIPRCEMVGLVNPKEYYQKASIIVMASSSSEGWGMVLVEAQQYGCVPIVLNTYAATRDIVKDGKNGLIVEPTRDWQEQFSKQIVHLAKNENKLNEMSSASMQSVKQFNIDIIGQQWLKLING